MRPASTCPGSASYSKPKLRAPPPSSSHTRVTRTGARTVSTRHRRSCRTMHWPRSGADGSQLARTIAGSAMRYSVRSRRATSHGPPGTGSPGGSPGSGWRSASSCQASSVDTTRADLDAAGEPPLGELRDPLEDRRPHVQLDLLAHAQVVVQEVGEPVARPRPRLDAELPGRGAEADLPRLEVAVE